MTARQLLFRAIGVAFLLCIVGLGAIVFAWWQTNMGRPGDDTAKTAPAPPPPPVAEAPPAAPPVPAEPVIQNPIEDTQSPIEPQRIEGAITGLVGRSNVVRWLQIDDFAHRIVATVDNLGRQHASVILWPVEPTPGRFSVEQRTGPTVIAAANAARYAPFLSFAESVDTARAVDLYKRFYPALQSAYRELGYPKGYFNDRLVQVIDLMIATPEPESPPEVALTDVKGPMTSTRPWVHYDYVDPALQELSAGQRILLRMGVPNERRAKVKLREVRAALATQPPPR